jgi:flagellar motility protein MotE (MotC chaperone)
VRRETIETREREINMREGLLKAAESRIDKKVQEMKLLQGTVEKLIGTYSEQQAAKVASLVKIYENMKPKDAARIFEELDMDTLLLVAERMKERSLAPIMANMDPSKARDVTVDLARRRQLPQSAAAGG